MSFSEIIKKNYESFPVKWWTKFAFHYTDISNALSVLQAGKLYSRLYAQEEHLMKNDNASYQVINLTASNAQSYVRFYFRPLTPTQYYNEGYKHPALRYDSDKNANVPVPIFFLFNLEKLLMDSNIKFSEMSQAGNGAPMLCGEKSFTELSFEKIYSDGFVDEDILKYRHAELLYPNSYEINNSLEVILCRNEFEQSMLLSLLRRENEKLFYKYKPMIKVCREKLFEKNGLFIHDIHLDGNKISFVFVNNYEKQQYTKVMMQKNLVNEIEPVKMLISFEWKTAKQTLKKESVNLNIDYLKTSGIAFTVPAVEKATILNTEVFCFGDLIGYKEFILTNII